MRNLPGGTFIEKIKLSLEKKPVQVQVQKNQIIAPIDFNPLLPKISDVFGKHFKAMLLKKTELKATFPDPPP